MSCKMVGDQTAGAILSEDERYRYQLWRRWNLQLGIVCWIMLNPSTALDFDDPTIRRCTGFAARWGYGGIQVVNLFAFRATDPANLFAAEDPIGPENNEWLRLAISSASIVCVAWGSHGHHLGRNETVRELVAGHHDVICLGRTSSGEPKHPLRLPYSIEPQPWPRCRRPEEKTNA